MKIIVFSNHSSDNCFLLHHDKQQLCKT